MNIPKAIEFIESSNDQVLISLAYFLIRRQSKEETLNTISSYQLPDGGWTATDKDFKEKISTISCTWPAIQWMIWLEIPSDNILLTKTIDFIKRKQTIDGYWDEPQSILVYNPKQWMKPEIYENQLWLTSAVCCKLRELNLEEEVDYDKAISFLLSGWNGSFFPVYAHTHWMSLCIFSGHDSPLYKEIFEGCKAYLMDAIENNTTDIGNYVTIAYHSYSCGKPANELFQLAYNKLNDIQSGDGGIMSLYGEMHRPGITLEALALEKAINNI
ncbi:MAG: hypothetical protein ACOC3T_03470 [Bacteroidota bacterium]